MLTNLSSTKNSDFLSKVIDKLMVVIGTIALVWILAFLVVAMLEK